MRLDLHLHTTASDGAWSPAQVVEGALGRLDVIAIADHDTVAGVGAALEAAEGQALDVIPALEVSSTRAGRELHILGYGVDLDAPGLMAHAERSVRLREARIEAMVERLAAQGLAVEMEAVIEVAGPERSALGRPHLARAMVAAGHVANVPEAFARFIGDEHDAFLPTALVTPEEAIAVIAEAGGVSVWAHPPSDLLEPLAPELVAAGLDGIEVYRPRAPQDQVRRLLGVARAHDVVVTGGSDWHTPDAGSAIGDFQVASREVADFLERLGY